MNVILLDKIANLGNLGDQVSVKAGYARNYLLPSGFAVIWTTTAWTIPANQALNAHPDIDYALVQTDRGVLLLAASLVEKCLERYGLPAAEIFPTPGHIPAIALPLVHCSADFLSPLVCGDPLAIQLEPRRLDSGSFEVHYNFRSGERAAAKALTRHLAIETASRRRCPLQMAARGKASGMQKRGEGKEHRSSRGKICCA